ncbi:MAG: NapC/NirT family cytochrome c [Dehalococcoidales bacterium]|nr:NapC/NirT family cytochrome c [Dehalococcoidales bacterium]
MRGKLRQDKVIFLAITGAISLVLLVMGSYQLYEFSESNSFCGQLCHTVMNPEYTVYQHSPHSRVPCVDCHVGPGADYLVKAKIRGLPQVFATLFSTYERPLGTPVKNLRPARDTCEQCHRPEIFSGDILRTYTTYDVDEASTERAINMVLRVGTGQEEIARDIHWHIAARVWYVPLDEKHAKIGWVGVEDPVAGLAEYTNPKYAGEITAARVEKEKRLMDCIDCHNRATHVFSSPEQLIDERITLGRIDGSLPYIKREALKALGEISPSLDIANLKVEALADFYRTNYPAVYSQQRQDIDNAIEELKEVALLTVFTEMGVDWQTHLDNVGHSQSEGCFRCHGTLAAGAGNNKADVISADCNACHYNPGREGTITTGRFIPHAIAGLEDCLSCHDADGTKPFPSDHVGRSNTLCTACHQPSTIAVPPPATPPAAVPIPHSITGLEDCFSCHGPGNIKPYPANHVGRSNSLCTVCHKPTTTAAPPSVPPAAGQIPHSIAGLEDCFSCHGPGSSQPYPADHVGRTNAQCTICHKSPQLPARPPATPPAAIVIPHSIAGLADCFLCHGPGSVRPYPANHVGRTNALCTVCHQPTTVARPPSLPPPAGSIPHSIVGIGDCLMCHARGGIEPFPSDHVGRTNSQCTICHQPGD